jgi:hypothetical protein
MASSGSARRGLLIAGGILSILGGIFLITGGVLAALLALEHTYINYVPTVMLEFFIPLLYYGELYFHRCFHVGTDLSWVIMAGCLGVIGITALAGGISSIRRRSLGLSLAGAICALPSVPSGILAVIFVALGKREFGAKVGRDGHRSGLVTAGGILSIIAGASEVVGGGAMVGSVVNSAVRDVVFYRLHYCRLVGDPWVGMPAGLITVGVPLLVFGAVAIVGGVSAARRKSFSLSLAGAICALPSVIFGLILVRAIPGLGSVTDYMGMESYTFCTLPSVILGILAVIFVSLGKREFGVKGG